MTYDRMKTLLYNAIEHISSSEFECDNDDVLGYLKSEIGITESELEELVGVKQFYTIKCGYDPDEKFEEFLNELSIKKEE